MKKYEKSLFSNTVGFIEFIYLPFAVQKSVSALVIASEAPVFFHRSRNTTGSKHDDPEPFFC